MSGSVSHNPNPNAPIPWSISSNVPTQSHSIRIPFDDFTKLTQSLEWLFKEFSSADLARSARYEQIVPEDKNYLMPARIGEYEALKFIRSRPANTPLGLERSQSTLLITDRQSGRQLYDIDGAELTPIKASLLSMLALKAWLSATGTQEIALGVIGGGSVARAHVLAAHSLFGQQLKSVQLYSPGTSATRIVAELGLSHPCTLVTKEDLLRSCNVIVTATTSSAAVIPHSSQGSTQRDPLLLIGLGHNDIGVGTCMDASTVLCEDPESCSQSTHRLSFLLRQTNHPNAVGLAEVLQGKSGIQARGTTVFVQYGNATLDLALCLAAMGIDPFKRAVSCLQP